MIKLEYNIPQNYGSKWKMVGEGRICPFILEAAWGRKEEAKAEASALYPSTSVCLQELGEVVTGSKLPSTLLLDVNYPAQIPEGQGEVEQDAEVLRAS